MKVNQFFLCAISLSLMVMSCDKEPTTPTPEPIKIGDKMEGGTVIYLDATGEHGIVMAPETSEVFVWGCEGVDIPGTSPLIGKGQANTTLILTCTESSMAKFCDDYESGGFSDWYMPSKNEVALLYEYHKANSILWQGSASSTQADATYAYGLDGNGTSGAAPKSMKYYTIPCRSF